MSKKNMEAVRKYFSQIDENLDAGNFSEEGFFFGSGV
jgi:hypothetical protein